MKNAELKITGLLLACLFMLSPYSGFSQCLPPSSVSAINGLAKACPGNSKSFTISAVAGAINYTWTLPSGCSINGLNPFTGSATAVTVDFGATFSPPGNISVKANNACGSSAPTSKTVLANYPTLSSITGSTKVCPGETFDYSVTLISEATYSWSVPNGATINSGQGTNAINVSFGAGFTGDYVRVSGNYGCGSGNIKSKYIYKNNPVKPDVIAGSLVACPNSTEAYSITPRSGETYNWVIPSGATIVGQGTANVSITFPSGFISTSLSVTSQNLCGSSSARTLAVRSNPATPGTISGLATGVCNTVQTYTIDTVKTATSYTWEGPVGSTITSGQGTKSATISFPSSVSGVVKVAAINACGTSAYKTKTVSGGIVITTQPQNLTACEDDTTTLSVNATGSSLSYQWRKNAVSLSDNADYSGTQTPSLNILKVDSLNAGNYDVVISNTCAGSITSGTAAFNVNMKPPGTDTIIHPGYACPGTSGVLSVPLNSYNTTAYLWEAPLGGITITGGQGTNSINLNYETITYSGYTIIVRAQNGCGLSHDTTKKWIRSSIGGTQIHGINRVCPGQTNLTYTGDNIGQIANIWSTSPGITMTSGQGTLSITVDFASNFNGGDVFLAISNQCMTTAPRKFHIYKETSCRIGDESSSSASSTLSNELLATPNPAYDKINLTFNSKISNVCTITISDIYGKHVVNKQIISEIGSNNIPLDLKNLPKGMYLVTVKSSEMIYQTKIIVEK